MTNTIPSQPRPFVWPTDRLGELPDDALLLMGPDPVAAYKPHTTHTVIGRLAHQVIVVWMPEWANMDLTPGAGDTPPPAPEPERKLRIEVTYDDLVDALDAADYPPTYAGDQIGVDAKRMLECFAERLARRQWVLVPADATIPVDIPVRIEGIPSVSGRRALEMRRPRHAGAWTPQDRVRCYPDGQATFFVPADRFDELIVSDLAARLYDRLAASMPRDGDLSVAAVRAALEAEGVEA